MQTTKVIEREERRDLGVVLKTYFPCHPRRKVRISATIDVPREFFERRCPECRERWAIYRLTLAQGKGGNRIDQLEWETVNAMNRKAFSALAKWPAVR